LENVILYGRNHGRDHGRDHGRSAKEAVFVMICITMDYYFYVRNVRSFKKYN
jgi:hypothetical protein